MKPEDKPTFATALLGIAELYERELSEAAITLWWHALETHDIKAITKAFGAHMMDQDKGHWMPKPADIVQQISGGPTQDLAALAWAKVERAIRGIGAYQTVVFDDAIIMMAISDIGGWTTLCKTTEEEMPFKAREFKQLYTAYRRNPKAEYPRALPGIAASTNEMTGYQATPPVLIGNREKALTIWHDGKRTEAIEPPTRTAWDQPKEKAA